MILTLLAVSLNDQPLTRPITARFDSHGGSIGRADHSTLSLPDPERVISRKQAEVVFMGDGFMIRNLGAANPITVAGRLLVQGETAPLRLRSSYSVSRRTLTKTRSATWVESDGWIVPSALPASTSTAS